MTDRPKNQHAVALGQRNKGKKKRITPELAAAMRERLSFHRVKRWVNAHPHGSAPERTVQGVVGGSGLEVYHV